MTFSVVYLTGGTDSPVWNQCRPVATLQEAVSQKDSIERSGAIKAMIQRTSAVAANGLPVYKEDQS